MITLKVEIPEEVTTLVKVLQALESKLGLDSGALKMEIMIESPRAIMGANGASNLPGFLRAAEGRCVAAHFGTYDYTASCNITAAHQHMAHPVCDFAKHMMQVAYANSGIWISDGATNIMPVAPHRGDSLNADQIAENKRVVHAAAALRAYPYLLREALPRLGPAPGPAPDRYAAVFAFFEDGMALVNAHQLCLRLPRLLWLGCFRRCGDGQGLLNYFLRAVSCGAISEEEAVSRSGVTLDELRGRSFLRILQGRKA